MKRLIKTVIFAAIPFAAILAATGCNDQIAPNQQLVDSMNKQRAAMRKNLPNGGATNSHAMTPEQATGQAPAPNGSQRSAGN
jgi:hypothetical protein